MQHVETVTYLEMTARDQLRPSKPPSVAWDLKRAEIPCPEINRFFYAAVGGDWYWVDRLPWTWDQWLADITRPGHETWIGWVEGTPAGYFELGEEPAGDIEIVHFGLLPRFTGLGLGGHLLTAAVRRAWDKGASRVWLHTSSFDHPRALANYLARGFRAFKRETALKQIPDSPPGPWPGARRCSPAAPPGESSW